MNTSASDKLKNALALSLLLVILISGFWLRHINLDFGLPYFHFYDETGKLGRIEAVLNGNVDPQYFGHPSFLIYSSALAVKLFGKAGVHPLVTARELITIECMLGAFFLFLCGLQLRSRLAGLFAASVIAFSPLAVTASQHVKEDIPLLMWLCVHMLFCLMFLNSGKRKHLYLAALFGGFAFSSKYPGIFTLLLLYFLVKWKIPEEEKKSVIRRLLLIFFLAFLIITPFAMINPIDFVWGFIRATRHTIKGHRGLRIYPWAYLWTYHLTHSLAPALSWFLLGISLFGVILCIFGTEKTKIVGFGFLIFYLTIETSPLKPPPDTSRYAICTLPYIALAGGVCLHRAMSLRRRYAFLVGTAAVIGLCLIAYTSYRFVCNRGPSDARTRAREWAAKNIPPDSVVLVDFHDIFRPHEAFRSQYGAQFRIEKVDSDEYENPKEFPTGNNIYYVASSLAYQRHLDYPDYDKPMTDFYHYLFSNMEEVARFKPVYKTYGFVDPEVRIFRMVPKTAQAGDGT